MKRNGRLRVQALGHNAPLQAQWYRYVSMRAGWFVRGGSWLDWARKAQVGGAVR